MVLLADPVDVAVDDVVADAVADAVSDGSTSWRTAKLPVSATYNMCVCNDTTTAAGDENRAFVPTPSTVPETGSGAPPASVVTIPSDVLTARIW